MSKDKRIILVCVVVIIGLIGCNVYLNIQNSKLSDMTCDNIECDNTECDNKEDSKNNTIKELDYDCSFTRTFRYLGRINYETYVDNTSYIMVDSFQSYYPMLLIVPDSDLAKMEENKYYEFTYTLNGRWSEITDFDDLNFLIKITLDTEHTSGSNKAYLEIKSTDKIGTDQISESICKGTSS